MESSSKQSEPQFAPGASSRRWEILLWALVFAAFSYALVKALRHEPHDLRIAPVLAVDAALAAAFALGYAAYRNTLDKKGAITWCVLYGLWAAAVFQLTPIIGNDCALFDSSSTTADVPYVILFAAMRGTVVLFIIWAFARRVFHPGGEVGWQEDEHIWELAAATVLTFYIIAAVVRLCSGGVG